MSRKRYVKAWTRITKKISFPVMSGIKSPTVPATDQSNPISSPPSQHPDTRVGVTYGNILIRDLY